MIRTPISKWPSVTDRRELPDASGIYAAVSELREVLYIGRTCSIRHRAISNYTVKGIAQPYRLAYFRVIAKHRRVDAIMSRIELALIRHYRPVLNRQSNPDYYARKVKAARGGEGEGMDYREFRKQHPAVRSFQHYTIDQRTARMSSFRMHHRQRQATGEFYYTHPMCPGLAFETAKAATTRAYRIYVERVDTVPVAA